MKILLTVKALTDGGAERVASLWANGFITQGHEVAIAINTYTKCTYSINERICVYNLHTKGNIFISHIKYILKLRTLIKRIHPDVIINILNPGALYDYVASIGMKIPIINTEHNAFERPDYAPLSHIESYCKFHFNKYLQRVTVLTKSDLDFIGNRLDNVQTLPNPCTFDSLKDVPEKKNIILAVGRLDFWHVKGFDVLIKAWAKISPLHPNWTLRIVGSSSKDGKSLLTRLCVEESVEESVQFQDFKSNIVDEYKQSAIFVLSSRYEGFGMVLLEAMSQGCACIACDYKGRQRDIVGDSEYGLICGTDDIDMLASKINKLISDDKLREDMQIKALSRSKEYTIDKIMEQWALILNSIG